MNEAARYSGEWGEMNRAASGGNKWGSGRTSGGKNCSSSITVNIYSNSSHLSVQMSLTREGAKK